MSMETLTIQYPNPNGLDMTKKEWESLSKQEQETINIKIQTHSHDGYFTRWEICGTEDHKRIYCCGVCGRYRRDKNFNPYVFDEEL